METGTVKAILETSNNILLEIYGDLLKPGVAQVGQALGTLIGLGNTLLMPIALKNEQSKITIQHNLNKYRQKLEYIPEENVQSVVPEIGVPILEKLMYVSDETLVELYTELLTKASDKEQCESTHPSFVNIINSLSPREVKILEFISKKSLALVFVSVLKDTYSHPVEQVSDLALENDLYDENATAHISNLVGLGLIDTTFATWLTDTKRYIELEEKIKQVYSNAPIDSDADDLMFHLKNGNLSFSRGIASVSSFGELFLKACTKNRRKTVFFHFFSRLQK